MKELSPIFLSGNGTPRSLECPIIQSPLAGVSDQIFRNFVRRWSPKALLFTEMVNAKSLELGHGEEKIIELSEENGPIGVQLFDHRPDSMIDAAIKAESSGAFLIDINMGCWLKIPNPKVKEVITKTEKEGAINLEGMNLSAIQPMVIAASGLKN